MTTDIRTKIIQILEELDYDWQEWPVRQDWEEYISEYVDEIMELFPKETLSSKSLPSDYIQNNKL